MDKATAGVTAPLGFWEYLEANKEEVRKWPGWMTGQPAKPGAPIRDCPDCGQEIHASAATVDLAYDLAIEIGKRVEAGPIWAQDVADIIRPYLVVEPSDSAAVREALIRGREQVLLMLSDGLAGEIRHELDSHDDALAALASTPAQPVHDEIAWQAKILHDELDKLGVPRGTTGSDGGDRYSLWGRVSKMVIDAEALAQRDAGEKLRLARRIETAIANRNDDETVFDAIKAALLAEGSKP